ncbi:MAG TPA: iron-containing alcohol dehydrogenase [Polyangiaceae bacterium]|nr:iron-containing alcohol dehydrogenase [Polyangiaceae bacterium]
MAIWSFPTRVVFGAGEVARTGEEARGAGIQKALVMTDLGVARAGLVEPIVKSLAQAGIDSTVFDAVEANPTEANIEEASKAYAAAGADGVVAIGGGSPLDAAKLVVLRAKVFRPFEELDDAVDGYRHIPAGIPPVIALPTTAGTGSEVGRSGVVTVRSTGRKTVIFSPFLIPRVAILDPELTRSMPAKVTAATGFDALTHCLEAYVSKGDHPMADAIALGGLELVAEHLLTAVTRGDDLAARGGMMKAAMMGAVSFQKGLGACHSLAHPLSSECGLHHGLANALCLPAVVSFNEGAAQERLARVARLFGGNGSAGSCEAVLRDLRSKAGLPGALSEVGVQKAQLSKLADLAFQDACHASNPRPCTRDDLLALYERSF